MFCPNCGTKIENANTKFCQSCGSKLADTETEITEPTRIQGYTMPTKDKTSHDYTYERNVQTRKSFPRYLPAVIIAVVVALVFLIAFIATSGGDKSEAIVGTWNTSSESNKSEETTTTGAGCRYFETASEAAGFFVEQLLSGSYADALSVCAVVELADNYNTRYQAERLGALSAFIFYPEYDIYMESHRVDILREYYKNVQRMVVLFNNSVLNDELVGYLAASVPISYSDTSAVLDAVNIKVFDGVEALGYLQASEISEDWSTEKSGYMSVYNELYGALDYEEIIVYYTYQDQTFVGGLTLMEFDLGWQITSLRAECSGVSVLEEADTYYSGFPKTEFVIDQAGITRDVIADDIASVGTLYFDTPIETAEYFANCFVSGDYQGILMACTLDEIVESYDVESIADGETLAVGEIYTDCDIWKDMHRAVLIDEYMDEIKYQTLLFCSAGDSDGCEYLESFISSYIIMSIKDMTSEDIDALLLACDPEILSSVTVSDIQLASEKLGTRWDSFEDNTKESMMEKYHSEDYMEVSIVYDMNGKSFEMGITVVKYESGWQIAALSAALLNTNSYGQVA